MLSPDKFYDREVTIYKENMTKLFSQLDEYFSKNPIKDEIHYYTFSAMYFEQYAYEYPFVLYPTTNRLTEYFNNKYPGINRKWACTKNSSTYFVQSIEATNE